MKKLIAFTLVLCLMLCSGCSPSDEGFDIVATTLPVYDFTSQICEGTGLSVGRLITESVSCLHDYTLQVSQMRMVERSDIVVISGVGLEDFLGDVLSGTEHLIDASQKVHIREGEQHDHAHAHSHSHDHEQDPHIWLSTGNAAIMAENICNALCQHYPQYQDVFRHNLEILSDKLTDLHNYGNTQLSNISCRELITFHDGFAYLAECFDLTILDAVEEESGSEASAAEIIRLVEKVHSYQLPAIFTEVSGSDACAGIIAEETGIQVFTLDMVMSGDSYFDAMYHNINTLKEALG